MTYRPTPKFVFVRSVWDLPSESGGVITLEDNTTYCFIDTVDLLGNRLVSGQNTTLQGGGSSENCRILSTGLTGQALITSQWSLPMRFLTIEADIALALDASGNAGSALDWIGVNFTNCATVGTIANYTNFIGADCAFLNSQGLTFDGSIGTVGFQQTLFDNRSGGTSLIFAPTLTITRRIRVIYSSFISLSGETALNVSTSAVIPVESYILDTCNFAGGGTYVTGVLNTDVKSFWLNCKGISNTSKIGFYTMLSLIHI